MILLALLVRLLASLAGDTPVEPPRLAERPFDRVIRLEVEYDEALLAQHGDAVEELIREAIAIHNVEWRRYGREWFELAGLRQHSSGGEADASYVLARFLLRTAAAPDTIHIHISGRQLEVYSRGRDAMAIGGLAYRGSDALVLSAAPGVGANLLAYYLFHEIGHSFEACDIPFGGGDTTFGSKTAATFRIDAGNEQIIEDSPGPAPRSTPNRAPMVIRNKLAHARRAAGRSPFYARVHDLLLHEPSPSNPAYREKKAALLADSGEDPAITSLLQSYEITPQDRREEAELRRQIAAHYWRANDAIRDRDFDTAGAELAALQTISSGTPDVHMLVAAVEKKVKKRRAP